jgi:hypothetical protein
MSGTAGLMALRLQVMASLKPLLILSRSMCGMSDALTISSAAGLIALRLQVMASLKTIADIIPIYVE